MNRAFETITVDSPNIPLISAPEGTESGFGQFIPFRCEAIESLLGPVKSQDLFTPNFSLRAFEGKMPRDAVFFDQHGQALDMLGSCILFKGTVTTFLPGRAQSIASFNHSQNFKFDPHNEFRHHVQAETDLNFMHISFRPTFLDHLLPENEKWADELKTKIQKKERVVGEHFAAISLAQEQALSNIFNTPLTGKPGYMMIETSIIQVILLQLYSLFHKEEGFKRPSVAKRDLETMQDLKDYLNKHFLDEHSISSLAQKLGTNTNRLMNLFKKVFGKSIFEYITDQRMDHARRLLREEGLPVTEVSRTLGYKNPNHFSSAFKKRFGVNPSGYRL